MRVNLPNKLTLLRLLLIPFFMIFTITDNFYTRSAALLIFIVAGLTDFFDGQIARERNLVTKLGMFLDPLADKLLISAAFIGFVQIREIQVPAWMVVAIIGREFLITGLRTLAASEGRILPAQPAGKFKTTSQIVAIIMILLILITNSFLETFHNVPIGIETQTASVGNALAKFLAFAPWWITLFTTILTVVSGYVYVRDNIDLINDRKS